MTPQPDALPACPPDPALVRGQRFHRALAASMTHVGTDHYGCGHCPRCADFCDGFVAGCESESAQSDIAHALASSRAEVERLRENLQRESRLACDLRSTQDEIIERCAKAVEEWPEAAARLRRHCGGSQDEYFAVSGEDFGEMRRTLDNVCRQYRLLLLETDEATMRRAFGDEAFEASVAAAKAVCERAIRATLSTAQQGGGT